MRLYIVGAAGSGKTTFANKLSKKLAIDCYHLDDIYYDSEINDSLNTDKNTNYALSKIIEKTNWIVEDNGTRPRFEKFFYTADSIVLLYPNKYIRLKRILLRYIKLKLKLEKCSYNPSIKIIIRMINGSAKFECGNDGLKTKLSELTQKVVTLKSNQEINDYLNNV